MFCQGFGVQIVVYPFGSHGLVQRAVVVQLRRYLAGQALGLML